MALRATHPNRASFRLPSDDVGDVRGDAVRRTRPSPPATDRRHPDRGNVDDTGTFRLFRSSQAQSSAQPIRRWGPRRDVDIPSAPRFWSGLGGVDLGHDVVREDLEIIERFRHRDIGERRPNERHAQPGFLIPLEVVGDLTGGADH